MSSYCLLTSSVSDEKSAVNLIEVPSIVHRQFLSCWFQDFFFFCLHLAADCRCGFEFILLEICVTLWMCMYCFHQIWVIFSHYVFKYFCSAPFVSCESESCSVTSNFWRPHRLYSPWSSAGQNTGVGSLSLLQGIFPIQGSNPGPPALQADSLPTEPQGKPFGAPIIHMLVCLMVSQWFLRLHSFFIHKG